MQTGVIKDIDYLQELIDAGYVIDGPRHDAKRDTAAIKAIIKKGNEFAPQSWLEKEGYQFIEPNNFTKGFRLAYKMVDDFPDERFQSNYTLVTNELRIPLYLKVSISQVQN